MYIRTKNKLITYIYLDNKLKKHTKGQLKYVFEYLIMPSNLDKFVKQGDVLLYCDQRRYEDTNGLKHNFKDNSRQVEKMRK